MRGSVWILIRCYLTNRRGKVFGSEQVYGFSEVREINTIGQQKMQYNKALNKALATYRSNHNLDSDTEVGFTHLNDGITYEGSKNGVRKIKRKPTSLSGADKREVRHEVLRDQKEKGESGKTITQEQMNKAYNKKVTQKEYNEKNKTTQQEKRSIKRQYRKLSKREKKQLIRELQDEQYD